MRKPEEIKKGLECCTSAKIRCGECPYYKEGMDCVGVEKDALAYIQQLEAQEPKWISVEERLPEPPKEVQQNV